MPTPGQTLRAARKTKKISLKQAMQATRIRIHYLEAIEADDLSSLPSAAQARGFLRAYADFLGIDARGFFSAPAAPPAPEAASNILSGDSPPQPVHQAQSADSSEASPPVTLPAPQAALPPQLEPAARPPLFNLAANSPPKAETPSAALLREIGTSLRLRREALSLTLKEVERHTRIRKFNLEAIEAGALDEFSSPVQARGMLNAYAAFLDMNGEAILLNFASALQARRLERQPAPTPRRARPTLAWPTSLRRFISPDLIFGASMVIITFGLLVWGAVRIFTTNENAPAVTSPSISDVLLATPSTQENPVGPLPGGIEELATPIVSGAEFPTESLVSPTPLPGTVVQITLLISERTLLRVLVDGELKLNERVAPGAALNFEGSQSVEVLTGNGAAVQVLFNQLDQGRMGAVGEVIHRIYTLNGITTPTPLPSPTPSNTPRFQRSPTPTLTPTLAPVVEP